MSLGKQLNYQKHQSKNIELVALGRQGRNLLIKSQ